MKTKSFEDSVLLQLKRQYSKDECLAVLFTHLSDLSIQLGVVTSERDELFFDLDKKRKQIMPFLKKDETFSALLEQIEYWKNKCQILSSESGLWQAKYLELLNKKNGNKKI